MTYITFICNTSVNVSILNVYIQTYACVRICITIFVLSKINIVTGSNSTSNYDFGPSFSSPSRRKT